MMRLSLPVKPLMHPDQPEKELSTEMTTGMSAPPIAATKCTPSTAVMATTPIR